MNVAILKNDSVVPELRVHFPDYEEMVRKWVYPFLKKGGDKSKLTVYDLKAQAVPAYNHDLYISTGSRNSVYDEVDWIKNYQAVVQELHVRKLPHFGICFGHQMIAQALGGKVAKSANGWGIGVHQWDIVHSPEVSNFSGKDSHTLTLPVSHQDQVESITEDMKTFLTSSFCAYAGLTVGKHIMSVQGHPEFEVSYITQIMERRKAMYTSKEYSDAKASLSRTCESLDILEWMEKFFFNS